MHRKTRAGENVPDNALRKGSWDECLGRICKFMQFHARGCALGGFLSYPPCTLTALPASTGR